MPLISIIWCLSVHEMWKINICVCLSLVFIEFYYRPLILMEIFNWLLLIVDPWIVELSIYNFVIPQSNRQTIIFLGNFYLYWCFIIFGRFMWMLRISHRIYCIQRLLADNFHFIPPPYCILTISEEFLLYFHIPF